ncbi:hypothetical protein [Humibacter ginsengisoli]
MVPRRIGAYVLPGDPVWLEKTLAQYYDIVDVLVVPMPVSGRGWNGTTIPVHEVEGIVRRVDVRGIVRIVSGDWVDPERPMHADTSQRQAALLALADEGVDWVVQLDNDEFLPDCAALLDVLYEAEKRGLESVEWPMRVLYRRTSSYVFEVVADDGGPRYEYPGAIAVRPSARLVDARRAEGEYLRVTVRGDERSLQLRRPTAPLEHRFAAIGHEQAIVHNSWARSPRRIGAKLRSWGHSGDFHRAYYYWVIWWPAPLTWRFLRDFHPFSRGLWPRLARRKSTGALGD